MVRRPRIALTRTGHFVRPASGIGAAEVLKPLLGGLAKAPQCPWAQHLRHRRVIRCSLNLTSAQWRLSAFETAQAVRVERFFRIHIILGCWVVWLYCTSKESAGE